MSRTDNTRPLEFQWDDPTLPGRIQHHHLRRHTMFEPDGSCWDWCELLPCDYRPDNNQRNFHARKVTNHRSRPADTYARCQRVGYHFGGQRHPGTKAARQTRRRRIRARERQALHQTLGRLGYEFDLLPRREDARTIQDDLS